MKLWSNSASPFARKARIVIRELGLEARIEELDTVVSPVNPNTELAQRNPLMKIPALTLDDGATLYDSRVICEYLNELNPGSPCFPRPLDARYAALRGQALADGILDAAVLVRYETAVRPEALRWQEWIDGQKRKVYLALDVLEAETATSEEPFDIGWIGAACVAGYLDFRFPAWDWRSGRPRLSAWYERVCERRSVAETMPR
jgi:glutathione S-transferase